VHQVWFREERGAARICLNCVLKWKYFIQHNPSIKFEKINYGSQEEEFQFHTTQIPSLNEDGAKWKQWMKENTKPQDILKNFNEQYIQSNLKITRHKLRLKNYFYPERKDIDQNIVPPAPEYKSYEWWRNVSAAKTNFETIQFREKDWTLIKQVFLMKTGQLVNSITIINQDRRVVTSKLLSIKDHGISSKELQKIELKCMISPLQHKNVLYYPKLLHRRGNMIIKLFRFNLLTEKESMV
jgi:hypothetical protein